MIYYSYVFLLAFLSLLVSYLAGVLKFDTVVNAFDVAVLMTGVSGVLWSVKVLHTRAIREPFEASGWYEWGVVSSSLFCVGTWLGQPVVEEGGMKEFLFFCFNFVAVSVAIGAMFEGVRPLLIKHFGWSSRLVKH